MATEVDQAYIKAQEEYQQGQKAYQRGQEAYQQEMQDSQEIRLIDHARFMAITDREFEVLALQEEAAKLAIEFYRRQLER